MENKVFRIGYAELHPILSKDNANREKRKAGNGVFRLLHQRDGNVSNEGIVYL